MGLVYEQNQNQALTYNGKIDGIQIDASSEGTNVGNASSIKLNGTEYSSNARGLNFVVYDKILNRIVGCVCFDTHDQSQLTAKNTITETLN